MSSPTIVEADITTLADALASGSLTSVDLVSKYLLRIAHYDCRNTSLNSVPLLNEDVFAEAAASDERRAHGKTRGVLDGIPFTVKDSYMVRGMTMAAGSEAFKDLVANDDAFAVTTLRNAGALVLGRTNMCPMAYGGMLRGVYGRAESPYNPKYLTAAFGSGSSNGSGTSTAASFAAFGLGGETVSSGRSPASNNGLVAYTPSRGTMSQRGTWPLYPTCDVPITHTRTVGDLLSILDTLTLPDEISRGDFWRNQTYVEVPSIWSSIPKPLSHLKEDDFLKGKRIAVPSIYIRQCDGGPFVSHTIEPLWLKAKAALETAGATVEEVSAFPAVTNYEAALLKAGSDSGRALGIPDNWNATERGTLIAHAWEGFLQANNGTKKSLLGVEPYKMFPNMSWDSPQLKFTEPANMVQWPQLAEYIRESQASGKGSIYDIDNLESAVRALEAMRKQWFEDWLKEQSFDFVVFPAVGDIGNEDAEESYDSAEHAWRNGVKYSHGNRALRHLGIPSVTVSMGLLEKQQMPMGLTILGPAYQDINVIKAAWCFEQASQARVSPPLTPSLPSDQIAPPIQRSSTRPDLSVDVQAKVSNQDEVALTINGIISVPLPANSESLLVDVFVDGERVPSSTVKLLEEVSDSSRTYKFLVTHMTARAPLPRDINRCVGKVARDSTILMILARFGKDGWPTGLLRVIHQSDLA